jgi:hypothetical protein
LLDSGEMMMAAGRKAASPTHNHNHNQGSNATAATRAEKREEEEGGSIGASLAHPLAEGGAASL